MSGISPRLWRLYAYFWLVCLFFPILYLIRTPLTIIASFIVVTGLAIFTAVYVWVMWPYPLGGEERHRIESRSSPFLIIAMTILVVSLSFAFGSVFAWLFVGISAITGLVLQSNRAFWSVTGLTLLTLGVSVITSGGIAGTDWLQVIPLTLLVRGVGLDMAGLSRLSRALWDLMAARQELARQAIVEERLRIARDLHDLLGHSLSLITLKSELARRLLDKDLNQAAQVVAEIEYVSRQALREVREAVAGYKKLTLASELDGARQILEAAGITWTIENTVRALSSYIELALAWTVREGVTNVIRHSRAEYCIIRIAQMDGIIRAEVINDGYRETREKANSGGTGLSGLGERIHLQGGRISAAPYSFEDRSGFRLLVEIPVQSNLAMKEQQK